MLGSLGGCVDEQALNQFMHGYYRSPDPMQGPEALLCAAELGQDKNDSCAWYFFARIAQSDPGVLRAYENLFRAKPVARPLLLRTLSVSGDSQTHEFLRGCIEDAEYSSDRRDIASTLQNWSPGKARILERRASTPYDLDLLWCEFMATGSSEPVLAIIDVLGRPDIVRVGLTAHLDAASRAGIFSRWRTNRRIKALAQAGIWIDPEKRTVVTAHDLDCYVSMEGGNHNTQKLDWFRRTLPFALSEADLRHIQLKMCANWSLAANARLHPLVHELCVTEAGRRAGRCRFSLLEIAALTSMGADDIESAFNRLHESLTPSPQERERQTVRAKAALQLLSDLAEATAQRSGFAGAAEQVRIRNACSEVTAGVSSYRAELSVRPEQAIREAGAQGIVFGLEFARPDHYRVCQTSGPDFDEWVIIAGRTFRAPAWSERASIGNEVELSDVLRADSYLAMLRHVEPLSAEHCTYADGTYLLLRYDGAARHYLPVRKLREEVVVEKAYLWIDLSSNYLVKASFQFLGPNGETARVVHCFTGHGDPIEIVPPPFQLLQPAS